MTAEVFVNKDNKTTFTCPNCSKTKTVDVSKHLGDSGRIKVKYKFKCDKCSCGKADCKDCNCTKCKHDNTSIVYLNRRQDFRKKVDFPGVFSAEDNKRGTMTVIDISQTGVKLKLSVKQKIKTGEIVSIEFRLDDTAKTLIKKDTIVRKIDDEYIGLEFPGSIYFDKNDKAIGFYLFG